MTTHDKLIHAVTQYDRKQSKKAGYNRNALGIYFARVDDICADIGAGASVADAIAAGFDGRLAAHCLRSLECDIPTNKPASSGAWYYTPASEAK
jgi:hypothetical protein